MRAARAGARPRPSRASVAGARARGGGGRAPPSAVLRCVLTAWC